MPTESEDGGDPLVLRLRRRLYETLARVIPPGAPVALLDFPNYSNVGDSAIWAGQVAFLNDHGNTIRYVAELDSFSSRSVRRAVGDGPVLIQGGGNFGDSWPERQAFKQRVVRELPSNPVVQLPQTIHFDDPANAEAAWGALARHPRLTVLCRDERSLALAAGSLRALLCPDMAFALGPLHRTMAAATVERLWLARRDREARSPLDGGSTETLDWLSEGPDDDGWSRLYRGAGRLTFNAGSRTRRLASAQVALAPALRALYERMAWSRVSYGVGMLSRARTVVTDRLHGHILCMLLGIPHAVLDTGHGKLTDFVATWTSHSPLVRVCASADEASGALDELELVTASG